jgi:hypothetical protein
VGRTGVAPVVDIETNVERDCLLKSIYVGIAATGFHFTRLTEASFIVSTPKPVEPKLLRSVDPAEARNARVLVRA